MESRARLENQLLNREANSEASLYSMQSRQNKRNMSMLLHCLGKEDSELKGAFSAEWVEEHFAGLLDLPKYTLKSTIPTTPKTKIDFKQTIYNHKEYHACGDGSVKVIDANTGRFSTTLRGHKGFVDCMVIACDRLFTGSWDKTINVWALTDHHKLIGTLKSAKGKGAASLGKIFCLAADDGKVFSGGGLGVVQVWDATTLNLIATLKGHTKDVKGICIDNGKLFSVSMDRSIRVWSTSDYSCMNVIRHNACLMCVTVCNGKLYSGGQDKCIKVWDIEDDYSVQATLVGHTSTVISLFANEQKLYSESWDNTIKVWKI